MKKTKRGDYQRLQMDKFRDLVIMHAHRKMGYMQGYTKTAIEYIAENVLMDGTKTVQRRLSKPENFRVFELQKIHKHFQSEDILLAISELVRSQQ